MSKNRELFENLLRQIELAESDQQHPMIQASEIKEVIVHEKSRVWEFFIQTPQILPAKLFYTFYQKLQLAFQSIAKVKVHIVPEENQFEEELLQNYWQLALGEQDCDTPLVKQVLSKPLPLIQGKRIVLLIDNETVIPFLRQQYLPLIEENLVSYGFPHLRVDPEVDKEQADKKLQEFEVRKQEQAQAMQEQAAASLAQYESKKKNRRNKPLILTVRSKWGATFPQTKQLHQWATLLKKNAALLLKGLFSIKKFVNYAQNVKS